MYTTFKLRALVLVVLALGILGVAPRPAAAADADVTPPLGAPGTTFTFFAQGYTPNELVSFWANTPTGDVVGNPADRVRAGTGGRADWTWTAPANASLGQWTMVAYGQTSGVQRLITFQIGDTAAAPPPSETQPIAISPANGAPGTMLSFYATGFDDRETVGYWVTAPDHTILGNRSYRVMSNRAGRADWSWRIPDAAQAGVWTMTAQGETSKVKHTIRFEVR